MSIFPKHARFFCSELVFAVLNSLQDLQEDTSELVNTVNNYYKGNWKLVRLCNAF